MQRIQLAEALERLGGDVVVELGGPWGFDPVTGWAGREDGKFHRAEVVRHPKGYPVLVLREEPNTPEADDGRPRVVGHVIVEVNQSGLVRTRAEESPNGLILELKPSSISKGELEQSGREPDALYLANAQRLLGFIAAYKVEVSFPDSDGLTPQEFVANSTDGRSITALAKLGLLNK